MYSKPRKESEYSKSLMTRLALHNLAPKKRNQQVAQTIQQPHKQPSAQVKMSRIIHQTNRHEEVHRLECGFAAKVKETELVESGKPLFTHTTKNKYRSYEKGLRRLDNEGRASVASENILKL